jgi:uncharacterized protein with von Willebrand factor type A (vWA) domain
MKVKDLIKVLEKHDSDLEVYFNDGNGPCSLRKYEVVEIEENVPEWNMEAGYTYLELSHW